MTQQFTTWPHDPTEIIREALREYVGDGDGEVEKVLAAHDTRVARAAIDGLTTHHEHLALQSRTSMAWKVMWLIVENDRKYRDEQHPETAE